MGIPEHETLSIEFKSDRKTIAEGVIVDEVVALSNTDGGELYIGVEDDGVPTGAQPQHRDPLQMNAMIANKTVPSVSVRTTILTESGKPVVRIEVPRSASVIASLRGASCAAASRRMGSQRAFPCIHMRFQRGCLIWAVLIIPPSPSPIPLVRILIPWHGRTCEI